MWIGFRGFMIRAQTKLFMCIYLGKLFIAFIRLSRGQAVSVTQKRLTTTELNLFYTKTLMSISISAAAI